MQDDDIAARVIAAKKNRQSKQALQQECEKARWFLIRFAALLAILAFLAFLMTGNIAVLLGDTILGIPLCMVFRYYFPKPQQ
jgi:hypothetical protein